MPAQRTTAKSVFRIPEAPRLAARYVAGLPRFLRSELTAADAERRIRRQNAEREVSFLDVLRRGIFEMPPYRALLDYAGLEYGDVAALVRDDGLERTLERLCDEGVYLTLPEFKGLAPIRRGGLELATTPEDFDNPMATPVLKRLTGGSRGFRRSVFTNFEHLTDEAAYVAVFTRAFDLNRRAAGTWRPVPPSTAGLNAALLSAKIGRPLERWFSQNSPRLGDVPAKDYLLTRYSVIASRMCGTPLPTPEHVPLDEAVRVARWLEGKRRSGTPAWLNAPASSGVRVCLAAREHGLDIAGTLFRLGGEPLTEAKAEAITATGSRPVCFYTMSEVGRIGVACGTPAAVDDVHVVSDKIAVIQRRRAVGGDGVRVGVLLHSTLSASVGKVMLNVESGDYGTLVERDCGCPFGDIGLTRHVHTIRSYEKLTTEGMNFLGSELIALVEEILPARFGGRPTDYQLVEEEVSAGLTKVSLLVSPKVGPIDTTHVLRAVQETLASGPSYRGMMAALWEDGRALRVVRREPYATPAGKLLPLHILRNADR
jgi:hypothetical protein